MEGFTYNGMHSSVFSCWYTPSVSDLMASTPDYEVMDGEVTGRAGGYYYGNRVKSREFSLSCYFEDITQKTKEQLFSWIDRNTSGKLIFDNRPFVYYNVRPIKRVTGKIYTTQYDHHMEDTYTGTLVITFKAYEPFGYMTYSSYGILDTDGVGRYCAILKESEMPPLPAVNDKDFLIYNCGTQVCDTFIRIAGNAPNGQAFVNRSNGSKCTLVTQPPEGFYLEIDGARGSVTLIVGAERDVVFEYHEDGFLTLNPCTHLGDKTYAKYTAGSNLATLANVNITSDLIGKYIKLGNEWVRIIATLADGSIVLNKFMNEGGEHFSKIAEMNEIDIIGDGYELTMLDISYVPRIY